MSSRGLEILNREECETLLQASDFGRVITMVGDSITAFPVFYARVGDDIIFRTDPGTKLAAAVLHTQVTFEVDDADAGWSVMATGYCEEVRSPDELDRALATLNQNWPEGERQRVVRVRPDRVTGRRLLASAGTSSSPVASAPSSTPNERTVRERIVVGVDNSNGSRRALEWAVAEATVRRANLEAVHVWHYPYVPTGPFVPTPGPGDESFEADARATLDASVNAVDGTALPQPVERKLVCDGAVAGLLAEAKGADLLVVGSRGRGGFSGLLLGSVSQEVAHHAPCPVVIVPNVGR